MHHALSSFFLSYLVFFSIFSSITTSQEILELIARSEVTTSQSNNSYFGTAVTLSDDGSLLAVGAPFPPASVGSTSTSTWELLIKNSRTTFKPTYDWPEAATERAHWGSHLSFSERGDKLASPFFDTKSSTWNFTVTWWEPTFPSYIADLPYCNNPNTSVEVALGEKVAMSGCNTNITYWTFDNVAHTVHSFQVFDYPETHELSMTTFKSRQLSCGTSSTTFRAWSDEGTNSWTEFQQFSFNDTQPFLQADCFHDYFAVGASGGNATDIFIYQYESVVANSALLINTVSIRGIVGDIALGDNIMAVALPHAGEVWVYTNIETATQPCLEAKLSWADQSQVASLSVSVGLNSTTGDQTVAVGAVSTNTSITGVVYILIDPCNPSPNTTSSATTTTSSAAITTSAATTVATSSTSTTTSTPSAVCSSNLAVLTGSPATCSDGYWFINSSTSNNGTVTISGPDIIIINGSFTQYPSGNLIIHANETKTAMIISGDALLAGTLTVILDEEPTTAINISVLNGAHIDGMFDDVQLTTERGSKCAVKSRPVYEGTAVLLQISANVCSQSKRKIIIIAVTCSIGGFIIVAVVVIIILVQLQRRGKLTWLYWSKPEGTHRRSMLGTTSASEAHL